MKPPSLIDDNNYSQQIVHEGQLFSVNAAKNKSDKNSWSASFINEWTDGEEQAMIEGKYYFLLLLHELINYTGSC